MCILVQVSIEARGIDLPGFASSKLCDPGDRGQVVFSPYASFSSFIKGGDTNATSKA